jgi:hypothetical protein
LPPVDDLKGSPVGDGDEATSTPTRDVNPGSSTTAEAPVAVLFQTSEGEVEAAAKVPCEETIVPERVVEAGGGGDGGGDGKQSDEPPPGGQGGTSCQQALDKVRRARQNRSAQKKKWKQQRLNDRVVKGRSGKGRVISLSTCGGEGLVEGAALEERRDLGAEDMSKSCKEDDQNNDAEPSAADRGPSEEPVPVRAANIEGYGGSDDVANSEAVSSEANPTHSPDADDRNANANANAHGGGSGNDVVVAGPNPEVEAAAEKQCEGKGAEQKKGVDGSEVAAASAGLGPIEKEEGTTKGDQDDGGSEPNKSNKSNKKKTTKRERTKKTRSVQSAELKKVKTVAAAGHAAEEENAEKDGSDKVQELPGVAGSCPSVTGVGVELGLAEKPATNIDGSTGKRGPSKIEDSPEADKDDSTATKAATTKRSNTTQKRERKSTATAKEPEKVLPPKKPKNADEAAWTLLSTKNGILSSGDRTLEKVSPDGWDCATRGSVGWSQGGHKWDVGLIHSANGVSVGICQRAINSVDATKNIKLRYDLYCGDGRAVDTNDDSYACFRKQVSDGDTISIRLDLDQKTVTFGLNRVMNPEPTFTNLAKGMWFPYFALYNKGSTVSVLKSN